MSREAAESKQKNLLQALWSGGRSTFGKGVPEAESPSAVSLIVFHEPPSRAGVQPISVSPGHLADTRVPRVVNGNKGFIMTDTFLKVELKFCECCGGLWLRDETANSVYCHHCAPQMMEVARGKKKRPVSVKTLEGTGGAVCA